MWRGLLKEETGEGMIEYSLIITLVAIFLIGTLIAMNGSFKSIFNQVTNLMNNIPAATDKL